MYLVSCDGYPLLDFRDDDFTLVDPKITLEVNTVGEGSFTIYKNHPHYDKLNKLKSVFEVSDENGVIFRGRMTGDSIDFDRGMSVDLEGAMAYFNDSVVRPFSFPAAFLEDADYIAAAESGNVIEFFLSWLIENHNAQVQDFQKMKLGNVTVTDPNNYIIRSSSEYASTWAVLKSKLFDSSLEGYLCIRYEEDGNYIDYLSELTETNSQEIVFGENLLDLKRETEASATYSAMIPLGTAGITIEGIPDGDITEDLVKSGDTIYSRKAVADYGWIYAPTSETTWEDVTNDSNLLKKAAEWLANGGVFPSNGIEATAVDLHFTDKQVESLRIYKNVNVYSAPHGLTETFPLTKLDIELLAPENTKITVGKTVVPITEKFGLLQDEAEYKYSKISKTQDEIRLEVVNKTEELQSTFTQTTEEFTLTVEDLKNQVSGSLKLDANGLIVTTAGESVTISGGQIDASQIKTENLDASKINVGDMNFTGAISWKDLSSDAQQEIDTAATEAGTEAANTITYNFSDRITASQERADSAYELAESSNNAASDAKETAEAAEEKAIQIANGTYKGGTFIDGQNIYSPNLYGDTINLLDGNSNLVGVMSMQCTTTDAFDITSQYSLRLNGASGKNVYIGTSGDAYIQLTGGIFTVGGILQLASSNYGDTLPDSPKNGQVFFLLDS